MLKRTHKKFFATDAPPVEQYGPVQVTVTWDREGDGDLIVSTPSGNVINYSNRGPSEATDFGQLEQDRRGNGPESIYWADAAPAGTYHVCFRTASFSNIDSDPVTVTATAFNPDGTRDTITKTFNHWDSNIRYCGPSSTNYVGSFVYHPSETPRPRPEYAQPPVQEEVVPVIIEEPPVITIHEDPIPMPEPVPGPDYEEEVARDLTQLGPLQFSVTWNRPGDGDIVVTTPSGKVINYSNRGPTESTDFGQLEVDRRSVGPESVYWDGSEPIPAGTYHLCFRTNSFNPREENPVEVTATIFTPSGITHEINKSFTESVSDLTCDPSSAHYIDSYTYQPE